MRPAAQRLVDAGADRVIVTRGGESALVLDGERALELRPPRLERGFREGCGDAMMGAMAACLAAGYDFDDALVMGAAAGAASFLRQRPRVGVAGRDRGADRESRAGSPLAAGRDPERWLHPPHEGSPRSLSRDPVQMAASMGTVASAASAPESRTGRPARALWASLPTRCTRPSCASSSGGGGGVSRWAAVTWISAPSRTRAARRSRQLRARVALGVGDHRAVAAPAQPAHGRAEGVADRAGRRLEQHPAPAAIERDRPQLSGSKVEVAAVSDSSPP